MMLPSLALLLCLPHPAWSQDAPAPASEAPPAAERVALFDFEADDQLSSWVASDAEAKLSITRDPANVAVGQGALEFAFTARPGTFERVSTSSVGVSTANALALRLKASSPTSVSFGVAEQGGAEYQGLLWVDANQWVDVQTPLCDLLLAQGSTDDNGRLDPDQISGFFLADLANLPGEVGQALGHKEGEQKLWLDNLALAEDPKVRPRGRVEPLDNEWVLVLDDFEGQPFWGLPVRQAGLKAVPGAPKAAGQRALEITYTLGLGRWVGYVLAPPGRFDLSTAQQLHMWAKTDLNARLVIVLEERNGAKYDTAAKVPPDDKWHPLLIPFANFAATDAVTDDNGQLDAAQVHRVIVLIDTFDADVRPGGFGSVTIDDVGLVVPAKPQGEGGP